LVLQIWPEVLQMSRTIRSCWTGHIGGSAHGAARVRS